MSGAPGQLFLGHHEPDCHVQILVACLEIGGYCEACGKCSGQKPLLHPGGVNIAVTDRFCVMLMWQKPVPVHAPSQELNLQPAFGLT